MNITLIGRPGVPPVFVGHGIHQGVTVDVFTIGANSHLLEVEDNGNLRKTTLTHRGWITLFF